MHFFQYYVCGTSRVATGVKAALVELIRRARDYSQDEATAAFDRYESLLARSLASTSPSVPPESAKAVSRATFSSEHRVNVDRTSINSLSGTSLF
jgi:hypothetical protein